MDTHFFVSIIHSDTQNAGKAYELKDGKPKSIGKSNIYSGTITVKRFDSLAHFRDFITTLTPGEYAICSGVPKKWNGQDNDLFSLVSRDAYDSLVNRRRDISRVVARVVDHFEFRRGVPGLFRRDYDYKPEEDERYTYRTEEELVKFFYQIEPEQGEILVTDSASTYFYHSKTGECLRAEKGKSIYTVIPDVSDTVRYAGIIEKRLLLNGDGFYKLDGGKSHTTRLKLSYDFAIYQTNRLDFASGSYCVAPLVQKRPLGRIYSEGEPSVDTFKVVISPFDTDKAEERRHYLKYLEEPMSIEKKEQLIRDGIIELRSRNPKVSEKEAREKVIKKLETNELSIHDKVFTRYNHQVIEVSVEEIMKDRVKYNGFYCSEPKLPDYRQDDLTIAIINSLGKAPNIHSFAHGGITYKLPLPNYGASKNIYEPVDVDYQWFPMVSFEEAQDLYDIQFRRFLKDKINLIMAGTGGTGKTYLILQLLLMLPLGTNVLILCHNHEKADELRQDLSDSYEITLKESFRGEKKCRTSRITFFDKPLQGKDRMCNNHAFKKSCSDYKTPISLEVCKLCPNQKEDDCDYVNQFDFLSNVVIMTHEEWNEESSFFFANPNWKASDTIIVPITDEKGNTANETRIRVRVKQDRSITYIRADDFNPKLHEKPLPKPEWKPDYVVIDECPIRLVNHNEYGSVAEQSSTGEKDSKRSSVFCSVSNILRQWKDGEPFIEVIFQNQHFIKADHQAMKASYSDKPKLSESSFITSASLNSHLQALKRWQEQANYVPFSQVIDRLYKFVETKDIEHLKGLRIEPYRYENVSGENKPVNRLTLTEVKCGGNVRYQGIPTLVLDGTADKDWYKACGFHFVDEDNPRREMLDSLDKVEHGFFEFHKILVRDNELSKTYQCQDLTVSRRWLQYPPENKMILVQGILNLTTPDEKVGVISYKNVDGVLDTPLFGKWMTDVLSEHRQVFWTTLGRSRGINLLKDCVSNFLTARHYNPQVVRDHYAIMYPNKEFPGLELEQKPCLYRMIGDKAKQGMSWQFSDDRVQRAYVIGCQKETVQGYWRFRSAAPSSQSKMNWILANESYGEDVELTELFAWKDKFSSKFDFRKRSSLSKFIYELEEECFQWKKSVVMKLLSLSVRDWRTRENDIRQEFVLQGWTIREVEIINSHRQRKEILICNRSDACLAEWLYEAGFKMVSG